MKKILVMMFLVCVAGQFAAAQDKQSAKSESVCDAAHGQLIFWTN